MKSYKKPYIEDETIELEDVIAVSTGAEGSETSGSIWDNLEPED